MISFDEDRRKHLDFIQAIVTRMSSASSSAKGWLLPVVTATYGFAATEKSLPIALLGLSSAIIFMYVDANYLNLERKYRELYDAVAQGKREIPLFSLNPSDAHEPKEFLSDWRSLIDAWIPPVQIWKSWSILPFYSFLIAIGLLLAVTSESTNKQSKKAPCRLNDRIIYEQSVNINMAEHLSNQNFEK